MCLNPAKSDATVTGVHQCLQSFPTFSSITVATLSQSDEITLLDVIIDRISHLTGIFVMFAEILLFTFGHYATFALV